MGEALKKGKKKKKKRRLQKEPLGNNWVTVTVANKKKKKKREVRNLASKDSARADSSPPEDFAVSKQGNLLYRGKVSATNSHPVANELFFSV